MKTGLLGSTSGEPVGLDHLLKDIASGVSVKSTELVPYLCRESTEERCQVNAKLAEAYAGIEDFEQAKVFVQRAWVLSEFSEDLLPLYLEIHAALGDIASIQAAYKRLGMKKADDNDIVEALNYFNLSVYSYARYQNLDKYAYDFDILERIEQMAKPHRFHPRSQGKSLEHRKIRVAYLTYLMSNATSVFYRINLTFARFHDKSLFDIAFFVPEPESAFQDKGPIDFLKEHNCKIITAPKMGGELERMVWMATQIHRFKPDLLVTNGGLGDLKQYFIASLRPAPIIVSSIYGPPAQFTSPSFDWGIASGKHPLMDSPCDCSLVELELDLSEQVRTPFDTKQQLNLPDDSFIIISAGRPVKFQEPEFWKAILGIMHSYPNVYYVAIGILEDELALLEGLLTPDLRKRLRLLGWRQDYLEILGLADVVIDTFPSGGGFTLMDAMSLGIPVVSFENNYMRLFDQTDWSAGGEFIAIPDLIVKRGGFEQFRRVVSRLIDDESYRLQMGELCKEQIRLLRGNPERMVRRCESIYSRLVENNLQKKALSASDGHSFGVRSDLLPRLKTSLAIWGIKTVPSIYKLLKDGWRFAARVKRRLLRVGST